MRRAFVCLVFLLAALPCAAAGPYYVHLGSTVGGDGTACTTTGATRAFPSLRAAIDSFGASLPAGETRIIPCGCNAGNCADSSDVNQLPWDFGSTPTDYLVIEPDAANFARVPLDTTRYYLTRTNSNVLYGNVTCHVRVRGLQIRIVVNDGISYVALKTLNANQTAANGCGAADMRVEQTVIECAGISKASTIGFHARPMGVGGGGSTRFANIFAYDCPQGVAADTTLLSVANSTVYGASFGYIADAAWTCKNCLSAGGTGIGFVGTFGLGTTNNAEDDGNGCTMTGPVSCANHRTLQTFTFVNAATRDLHLAGTDAGARNFGLADPLSGFFSNDFDGATRPGESVWDIGADEFGSAPAGGGTAPAYIILGCKSRACSSFRLLPLN
uniref:hypothetical protein n=1 Tax=Nitrospira cf. moscoviensis SBR1015 TaxID=96242 RepID=UPI001180ED77|nr:hypothetical protein [Nitrospira cf. moscoviensis SBR1015]